MKDARLFSKAIRENSSTCSLAALLLLIGFLLLLSASQFGLALRPEWFDALPLAFWRVLGLFFCGAAFVALLMCYLVIRHGYKHYLFEKHGITRSAQVLAKDLAEVRLNGSRPGGADNPRLVRFGQVVYRYEMDGDTIEDSFILSEPEIGLFDLIQVGDQIPIRLLPHRPRQSSPHRTRLHQQYRWSTYEPHSGSSPTRSIGALQPQ